MNKHPTFQQIEPEKIAFIKAHLNDRPYSERAREIGVSIATWYKYAKALGYQQTGRNKPRLDVRQLVIDHYAEMSSYEIAEAYNCDYSTVQRWAVRLGIEHSDACKERLKAKIEAELRKPKTPEMYARAVKKSAARRKLDQYLVWSGMPQRTRYRLRKLTSNAYSAKSSLKKRYGYIADEARTEVLYYTTETRRSKNEAYLTRVHNLKFELHPDCIQEASEQESTNEIT